MKQEFKNMVRNYWFWAFMCMTIISYYNNYKSKRTFSLATKAIEYCNKQQDFKNNCLISYKDLSELLVDILNQDSTLIVDSTDCVKFYSLKSSINANLDSDINYCDSIKNLIKKYD